VRRLWGAEDAAGAQVCDVGEPDGRQVAEVGFSGAYAAGGVERHGAGAEGTTGSGHER
jgi:hypothetical protein